MNWFANGTKSKQSVITLRSDLILHMVTTFGKYTSLKASARWESFYYPPVASWWMSLPWWRRRRQWHKTNGPSSSAQFPRRTSISLWFVVPFLLASWLVLICSLCFRSDGIWSLCSWCLLGRSLWTSLVHNCEPKRWAALRFPFFDAEFRSLFCRKTTSPRLCFWTWTGFPSGGDVCYLRNHSFDCEWASVLASK